MAKTPRNIDRTTSEDTARMQAIWTGMILAVAVFGASFFYFYGTRTDMASGGPAIEAPRTSGSGSLAR